MIAVDTNIAVRYLVEDDVAQTDRAETVLRSGAVWLPKTVLLETEWVLRTQYRFARRLVATGLERLFGLPGVTVEDAAGVAGARMVRSRPRLRRCPPPRVVRTGQRLRDLRSRLAPQSPGPARDHPGDRALRVRCTISPDNAGKRFAPRGWPF